MISAIYQIAAYARHLLNSIRKIYLDGSAVYGACMAGLPLPEERCSDTVKGGTRKCEMAGKHIEIADRDIAGLHLGPFVSRTRRVSRAN
jgi:hypothetical protein